MEDIKNIKVGEIVIRDFRAAAVFKNVGIDFCCGGNQTLEEACLNKKLDINFVTDELVKLHHTTLNAMHNYHEWGMDFLCDYIVNTHHRTVRKLAPELVDYTRKLAQVHGANHPELIEIAGLFSLLERELMQHLEKEEQVLFPAIKKALAVNSSESVQTIASEISRMEGEHEFAGRTMDRINELSDAYSIPPDACNTYKLTYKLLEEFEDDLHIHVHLENNILYPKSLQINNILN